jgi:hypothetical protein
VASKAQQPWFVMLRDEAAAGRVVVRLKPFLKFSRRLDKQLKRFERRMRESVPQLAQRGTAAHRDGAFPPGNPSP